MCSNKYFLLFKIQINSQIPLFTQFCISFNQCRVVGELFSHHNYVFKETLLIYKEIIKDFDFKSTNSRSNVKSLPANG